VIGGNGHRFSPVNGSEVWSLPVSTIHSGWPGAKTALTLVVALLAWQYTISGLGGMQPPGLGDTCV
jgi:hypothetical protein